MQAMTEHERFGTRPGPFPRTRRLWWLWWLILNFFVFLLPWAMILVVLIAWIVAELFLIYVAVRQFVPTRH